MRRPWQCTSIHKPLLCLEIKQSSNESFCHACTLFCYCVFPVLCWFVVSCLCCPYRYYCLISVDDACIWQILLLWLLWFLSASFCLPSCARPVRRLHSDYRAHFLYLVPLLCLSLDTWICAPGFMTDSSTSWNTLINKNPGCKCSPSFTHFFYVDLL